MGLELASDHVLRSLGMFMAKNQHTLFPLFRIMFSLPHPTMFHLLRWTPNSTWLSQPGAHPWGLVHYHLHCQNNPIKSLLWFEVSLLYEYALWPPRFLSLYSTPALFPWVFSDLSLHCFPPSSGEWIIRNCWRTSVHDVKVSFPSSLPGDKTLQQSHTPVNTFPPSSFSLLSFCFSELSRHKRSFVHSGKKDLPETQTFSNHATTHLFHAAGLQYKGLCAFYIYFFSQHRNTVVARSKISHELVLSAPGVSCRVEQGRFLDVRERKNPSGSKSSTSWYGFSGSGAGQRHAWLFQLFFEAHPYLPGCL